MRSFPVRIDVDNRGEKLDQMSRICYSKPHTIDHRVEVKPFGMVNKDSWYPLMRQFDEVWLRSLGGSRGRYPPGGDSSSQRGSSRGQHILQTAIGERSQRPAAPEPTREAQLTSRRGSQNQAPPLQLTAAAINCAAVAALCRSGTVNEQQAAGIVRSHISAAMAEANRPLSIPESFEVAIRAIASRGGGNERARETLGAMLRQ
ncbi:hypothetical protein K431DRAFT_281293 [Polychaeton citri CBS 116435]|uniref:DUF6590 domain-containing protein n=1 Tax=Polychaeton citri CBS 116435 TaxID=1314669 RepID=A0A9P4QDP6_9PEZI|nr:hypothetical protein K431DRAFT_281293 [Polychaeton citri CBS 116435]